MRLTVDGREVQIYFQYGTSRLRMKYGTYAGRRVQVPSITCVIREAPPVGTDGKTLPGSNTTIISSATSYCGPEDRDAKRYDKVLGRWIAFRKALDGLSRNERKALGDWYRKNCKLPRNANTIA